MKALIEQARNYAYRLRHPHLAISTKELADALEALGAEVERLQKVLDSRPAINAGLPATYIEWSQSIYAMELGVHEVKQ